MSSIFQILVWDLIMILCNLEKTRKMKIKRVKFWQYIFTTLRKRLYFSGLAAKPCIPALRNETFLIYLQNIFVFTFAFPSK